jgi:hypothetical protein
VAQQDGTDKPKVTNLIFPGHGEANWKRDGRVAWIDKRKTALPEDKAYSLFGILGTCICLLYGEGGGEGT